MQLATTAVTGTPKDKTSWPVMQALPTDLPAPARERGAKYQVWGKFSAGSIADHRTGSAVRVSPTWDWNLGDPLLDAVRLLGTDPRAALAAAAAMAGREHLQPADYQGKTHMAKTLVGLYRTDKGQYFGAPLWYTPGTNDYQYFGVLANTFAAQPDTRFTFRDDRLAAVVAVDGFIANPTHAASFTH
jgi:hypothetical protein